MTQKTHTLFSVTPIPAFQDNYIWGISNSTHALVIDPGDAEPVLKFLKSNHLSLTAILITHHHKDHTGGVENLVSYFPSAKVYAPASTKFNCLKHDVRKNSCIQLAGFPEFSVIEIPGHTLDHIAFYGLGNLFCGDTLFSAGCGKVFEGTYDQMYSSLLKIKSLPSSTNIYCGHEYTLQNLYFAKAVDPDNTLLDQKIMDVSVLQETKKPSLPSTLKDELKINPFLRCDFPEIVRSAENHIGHFLENEVAVFKVLREWKNNFVRKERNSF